MKIEIIKWLDSCSSDLNWVLRSDLGDFSPIVIMSVGFVIEETDDYIVLAQNYGIQPEQVSCLMTIPKGCIQTRQQITMLLNEEDEE